MSVQPRKSPYAFLPALRRDARGGAVLKIHEILREAIVKLEIPPGADIDKNALCARLGVSRFPVSEALGRLAEEGFVEILPQRSTRVSRIDLAACREAMFIRAALEAETVQELARRPNAGLTRAIEQNLRAQRATLKSDDRIAFHALDIAFHDLLLDRLGYERVKSAVYGARAKLDRMRLFLCTPARQSATYEEHRLIASALAAGQPRKAADAMRKHLQQVLAELALFAAKHPDSFTLENSGNRRESTRAA